VESLGFPWDEAHAEADRLEHHVSAGLEARLEAALGFSDYEEAAVTVAESHLLERKRIEARLEARLEAVPGASTLAERKVS